MNRINGKRALHRSLRAQTGIGPLQFLHNEAVSRVAQSRAAIIFKIRAQKTQRAHSRRQMFRKFARAMTGHDLGHDFLLHKTPCPIARGTLFIGQKFFDGVVIQRRHAAAD